MADILANGMAWLAGRRAAYLATAIAYTRGSTVVYLDATRGKSDYEVVDEHGVSLGAAVADFICQATLLGLTPEPGDQIVAGAIEYEVMNVGGEGCWRWSDQHRVSMRIHVKEVGPVTTES